ncbi:XisI protein [Oscillatoria sp. FACHB-1406]|uniref:XisI protein n=1 Tax=Oscillatoria sp. FACHB-1406 TaxID=2692846 RepID=UPI0016861AA9|nr:XisI protein [Oscillatoria sp. FACHB-1406]MBD2577205.1 XisI protein [Oscillatoria sp. FACHB-1406]
MDRLNYRELIQTVIQQHANEYPPNNEIQANLLFDERRDRYLLLYIGWRGEERFHGCPIHIDLIDGKIWIQQDFTEEGLAQQLVELGVPKSDIILGFRAPYVRQFTGFAVA